MSVPLIDVDGVGDRVNSSAGTDYQAASFETSDARGIEVAFLYDSDRVDLHIRHSARRGETAHRGRIGA